MNNPWTIPFDGITYVCWKDNLGKPEYRALTREEETTYFTVHSKEKYLYDLLNK